MGDKSAEKPVDGRIIKKTQDSLGKIIKKPPLTDKLLQKPPFRFLHDIITSVIKQTGFMRGLFIEAEMNSENVKDKDKKILFLQKLIDMVSLVLGKAIAAKPSKIVAGHDADKTNELLQALAEAINKKIDNDDYVRRVLKTDDVAKPPQAAKKESTESTRSQNKDREDSSKKRSGERGDKEKSGDRRRSRDRESSKDNETESRSRDAKKDKEREGHHRSRVEGGSTNSEDKGGRRESSVGHGDRRDVKKDDTDDQLKNSQPSSKGAPQNDSKKENQLSAASDEPRQTSAKNKAIRPSSARPAPPKPKKNEIVSEEPVIMGVRKVPNVIVDKKDKSDDEEIDNDDDNDDNDLMNVRSQGDSDVRRQTIDGEDEGDGSHGGLVKKILEAKKEAESQPGKKTEIDRSQVVSDVTRRKEREVIQRDIDRLRASVQTLTRSVNPLGKILDFVQEDFDAMQKELDVWRRETADNVVALQREESITESAIEPLKAQLAELDSAIRDQLDLIAAVKSIILHNDLKITKMLGSVTKS